MSETVWYFDKGGRPAFYRVDDNVFKDGKRIYWVSGTNWFSNQSGRVRRELYESDKWLFDANGNGKYYRS